MRLSLASFPAVLWPAAALAATSLTLYLVAGGDLGRLGLGFGLALSVAYALERVGWGLLTRWGVGMTLGAVAFGLLHAGG